MGQLTRLCSLLVDWYRSQEAKHGGQKFTGNFIPGSGNRVPTDAKLPNNYTSLKIEEL